MVSLMAAALFGFLFRALNLDNLSAIVGATNGAHLVWWLGAVALRAVDQRRRRQAVVAASVAAAGFGYFSFR